MSFERGLVVKSLSGRDKGKLLAVISVENGALKVCDGKERRLQKPKTKNSKHVVATQFKLTEEDLAFNGRLRRAINRLTDD